MRNVVRRRKRTDWRFLECGGGGRGCGRVLEAAGYRMYPPPGDDVPDERITWNPAPRSLMLACTCGHYTVFAPTSEIELMKAMRKAPALFKRIINTGGRSQQVLEIVRAHGDRCGLLLGEDACTCGSESEP